MINAIFDLLEDGKWHNLAEIIDESGLRGVKLKVITNFLAEYNLLELNQTKRKARFPLPVVDFLKKIKHIEKDEG